MGPRGDGAGRPAKAASWRALGSGGGGGGDSVQQAEDADLLPEEWRSEDEEGGSDR